MAQVRAPRDPLATPRRRGPRRDASRITAGRPRGSTRPGSRHWPAMAVAPSTKDWCTCSACGRLCWRSDPPSYVLGTGPDVRHAGHQHCSGRGGGAPPPPRTSHASTRTSPPQGYRPARAEPGVLQPRCLNHASLARQRQRGGGRRASGSPATPLTKASAPNAAARRRPRSRPLVNT